MTKKPGFGSLVISKWSFYSLRSHDFGKSTPQRNHYLTLLPSVVKHDRPALYPDYEAAFEDVVEKLGVVMMLKGERMYLHGVG